MNPGLQGAMIAVAVGIVLTLILAGAKKPARTDPKTGNPVLRYHSAIRIVAYVAGMGMCILIIVLMIIAPFKKPEDPLIAGGMLFFFALLGGYLYLESTVRIELAEDGVLAYSPWRRVRFLKWDEIKDVKTSSGFQGRGKEQAASRPARANLRARSACRSHARDGNGRSARHWGAAFHSPFCAPVQPPRPQAS